MLKIKDNVDLKELDKKYNLDIETVEGDWEMGISGDYEHNDGHVFISEERRIVYGIDFSNLDLVYDLIKDDLIEKVEDWE